MNDYEAMELGVRRLLGKEKYPTQAPPPVCDHESDGHVYADERTYTTLRCYKCGLHYDKPKY